MSLRALLAGEVTSVPFTMKGDLTARFFSSVGVPVHNLHPEQNLPLLRVALTSAGHGPFADDYTLLQKAGEIFEPEFKKVMNAIGRKLGIKEITFRETPKDAKRMREKEKDPSEGASRPASHTDVNAVTIYARNALGYNRAADFFRPANNANTAQFKDKAAMPDENGFPGTTIKFVLEKDIGERKKVPFVTEVLLLMDGCQPYYKRSHNSVDSTRVWDRWWSTGRGVADSNVAVAASYLMGAKNPQKDRLRLNEEMAKATGMCDLRQKRQFYLVDETPVAYVTDAKGNNFCFVPDPKTGFYRLENRYLTDGSLTPTNAITRDGFLTAALVLVPEPDLTKAGKFDPKLSIAA